VVGIIVSLAIVAGGLYLVMTENNSDMGLLGAMLLVLGATFLAVNLYMHRQGFRMRRRRR
jgi:drug/metabolite transporter (DMT)-like permease